MVQPYSWFSKNRNGKPDLQPTVEILVSQDHKLIVAAWNFANRDGNRFKLDSKGEALIGRDGLPVRQDKAYSDERSSSNSNLNFVALHKITNGDKTEAGKFAYWERNHVVNAGTRAQILRSHKAMGWGGEGTRGKFTFDKQSGRDQEVTEYKALMGTENLSPTGYMYADHVQFFEKRYPLEINTFPRADPGETNIWAKVGVVPTGKGQKGLPS